MSSPRSRRSSTRPFGSRACRPRRARRRPFCSCRRTGGSRGRRRLGHRLPSVRDPGRIWRSGAPCAWCSPTSAGVVRARPTPATLGWPGEGRRVPRRATRSVAVAGAARAPWGAAGGLGAHGRRGHRDVADQRARDPRRRCRPPGRALDGDPRSLRPAPPAPTVGAVPRGVTRHRRPARRAIRVGRRAALAPSSRGRASPPTGSRRRSGRPRSIAWTSSGSRSAATASPSPRARSVSRSSWRGATRASSRSGCRRRC